MKKFLSILLVSVLCLSTPALAETIKVISLENFSTTAPSEIYKVKTAETEELDDGRIVDEGTIITGRVSVVKHPKRGKRNASFEFIPLNMTTANGETQTFSPTMVARVVGYVPFNAIGAAGTVAKTAVGFIIPGADAGISFIQGVSCSAKGSRIKSGFKKVYEDCPISYIEHGKELNIKPGDMLLLKIKKTKKNGPE